MNECQQLKKSNFIYALKASATSTCWLLPFWNFSKWFSHQTQIIQNASLHNMTVHRYSWKSLYIAPFLKHSNRRSYRIHAYLPKIYRKIINITKSDFSGNFKNFQTKFSNSTWSLKILIHTHFPVEILSGSLKPTFPEFQLT